MGLNRVILIGTLKTDPELRFTKDEIPVARLTLCVKPTKANEEEQFFNCVAWRGLASVIAEYCKKGSLLAVEGKVSIKPYTVNGIKKFSTEITLDNCLLLDKKFYQTSKKDEILSDIDSSMKKTDEQKVEKFLIQFDTWRNDWTASIWENEDWAYYGSYKTAEKAENSIKRACKQRLYGLSSKYTIERQA